MGLFTAGLAKMGIYKEVYVCLKSRLLYKAWFRKGKKTASRMFHSGEGLALYLNKQFEPRT